VYQPDKTRLGKSFQQLVLLRRFTGVQVQVPDLVPDLFITFLLHTVHVCDRPQAWSYAAHIVSK